MTQELKDILDSDYGFVLISGSYFDCPSCNPSTCFEANTFYDEKQLLEHITKMTGLDYMKSIWLIDRYSDGHMAKFCDIETSTGYHSVSKLEFDLPSGRVIIEKTNEGYKVASPAKTVLDGQR